ncbi:hypothetical protein KDA11_02115 [Candidatus Saccharibacteria bacterium]|nr:hypothetical protein [Candidatus Saccharibacteria bacterium]
MDTQQQTQTQANSQQNQPMAYMQNRVQYLGKTVFGGGMGLIEWGNDGHIRLFDIDPASGQSKGIIFDCLPSQIGKASASYGTLELWISGQKHRIDFSGASSSWIMAGGALGLLMANVKEKESGVQWWIDNLRTQGVNVRQFNQGKVIKYTLISVLGIVALFILITFIGVAVEQ